MYLAPYPEHTKQTRCNNNLSTQHKPDFFRPIISNPSVPIIYNHDHYMSDPNHNNNISNSNLEYSRGFTKSNMNTNMFDLERSSISTRNSNVDNKKPVQSSFQSDYYTMSLNKLNHINNQDINHDMNNEINTFLTRNPVNSRRDNIEKTRNQDKQDFLQSQGGMLSNFNDIRCENTRQNKGLINSANYVPMARTMAIPKENI